jgi:hypothetical protein
MIKKCARRPIIGPIGLTIARLSITKSRAHPKVMKIIKTRMTTLAVKALSRSDLSLTTVTFNGFDSL